MYKRIAGINIVAASQLLTAEISMDCEAGQPLAAEREFAASASAAAPPSEAWQAAAGLFLTSFCQHFYDRPPGPRHPTACRAGSREVICCHSEVIFDAWAGRDAKHADQRRVPGAVIAARSAPLAPARSAVLPKHVGAQAARLVEAAPAVGALEGLLAGVAPTVSVQVAAVLKGAGAHVAPVRALSRVHPHVALEVGPVGAAVAAVRALVPGLVLVRHQHQ